MHLTWNSLVEEGKKASDIIQDILSSPSESGNEPGDKQQDNYLSPCVIPIYFMVWGCSLAGVFLALKEMHFSLQDSLTSPDTKDSDFPILQKTLAALSLC